MSLQDDPGRLETKNKIVMMIGLFAVVIVCLVGTFITLNTLISQGFFAAAPGAQPNPRVVSASAPGVGIGFNFTNQKAADPTGDGTAKSHLFVHQYPLPEAGFVTGITYRNDREARGTEISETITLLILRPDGLGWKVLYRILLPTDDNPPATSGNTTLKLEPPLPVEPGDIFAHWQAGNTGPIPVNYEDTIADGLSTGQFGFSSDDLEVGQIIRESGFSGQRDYFINLIFEPAR